MASNPEMQRHGESEGILLRPILTPIPQQSTTTSSAAQSVRSAHSIETVQSTQTAHSQTRLLPLPSEEPLHSQPRPEKHYFRDCCHTLRLQLLYMLWAKATGRNVPEETKTAFYRSRRLALVRSLIHLVPFGVALYLVILNWAQYYIGEELQGPSGQDTEKLAALQFAAKLHELLILASLGTVLFSCVRHTLAFGEGVTLGTLLATQQFGSINTLWSLEFWSAVFQKPRGHHVRKWLFILLLVVCILLGVSVGPSSANLMRPRQDFYPAGGSAYWVNSPDLYPERVGVDSVPTSCSYYTANALCPYGDYQTLAQGHLPFWPTTTKASGISNQILVPSRFSLRRLLFCHRSANDDWKFDGSRNDLTWGTISSPGVSDGLVELTRLWNLAGKFSPQGQNWRSRSALTVSTVARQPLVHTFCNKVAVQDISRNTTSGPTYELRFANISSPIQNPSQATWNNSQATWNNYSAYTANLTPPAEVVDWMTSALLGAQPALYWTDNTTILEGSNSSLAAIAVFPKSAGVVDDESTIYVCSIGSWWVPFTTKTTDGIFWTESTQEGMSHNLEELHGASLVFPPRGVSDWNRVYPSAGWANLTNPIRNDTGWHVFAEMAAVAGLWNCSSCTQPVYGMPAVENIITLMLVNGLGRMPYGSTNVKKLKGPVDPENQWEGGEWQHQLLPRSNMGYGIGNDAYDLGAGDRLNATRLVAKVDAEGYAYSYKGKTQKLSIFVMLIFCVLAFVHFCWLLKFGESSGVWDTPSETTAVALRSERTDVFNNTGAGIDSEQTWANVVVMRLKDDHIQMVFEDTQEDAWELEPNKKYG